MKYLIVALVILLVACCEAVGKEKTDAQKRQDFLTKITKECSEENDFDLDSGMRLLLGDLSINSDKAKCFVRCVFLKEGFINENSEVQVEVIVEALASTVKVKRQSLTKIIKKCGELESENACDSAFKLLECYLISQNVVKKTEL